MSNDNYSTPTWITKLFEGWYDPCTLSDGKLRAFDGLGEWKNKTFVNPPFSDILKWVEKAIEENKKGKTIVLLIPCDPSTKYYLSLKSAGAHIIIPNERVKFNGKSPRFSCMLAVLEGNILERTKEAIKKGEQTIL